MLGIVCGMESEVRALGRRAGDARVRVGVSGARSDRAESEARRLVEAGCRLLLSWGVAGGLDPLVRPGEMLIPVAVVDESGGCWPLSLEHGEAAAGVAPAPFRWEDHGQGRMMLGLDRLVLEPEDKSALFALTGALAADMETHRVAQVAAEAGVPALAVRAVGDPVNNRVPELAVRALGEDGRPRVGAVAAGLARRPWDLGALMRVRRETDAALETLTRAADAVVGTLLEGLPAR